MKEQQTNKTLGTVSIIIGAMSFIPLIGFFLGFLAILLGLIAIIKNKSKRGIIGLILGVIGILITVGLYGALFYFGFVQRGGIYDKLRTQMATELGLPDAINAIEAYKVRFGKYPDKIEDLTKISSNPTIFTDPTQLREATYYYYENNGDTYYLFSKGYDGEPFTEDDIYPKLSDDLGEIGYRKPNSFK